LLVFYCLFKDGKRGGFCWHCTKITHPKRAERHWLAIAIATLWQVSVGGAVDANLPISSLALFCHFQKIIIEATFSELTH
jgi:hypothetical protein